jgi:hypothetical protein
LEKVDGDRETAEKELKAAREARGALEAAYRKHTRLVGELREAEGKRDRDSDRVAEAKEDLADLAAAEEEMGRLRPETDRMPEVAAALDRLEQNRQKAERRERDRRESLLRASASPPSSPRRRTPWTTSTARRGAAAGVGRALRPGGR